MNCSSEIELQTLLSSARKGLWRVKYAKFYTRTSKKKGEKINGNDSSNKKKCSFENVDRKGEKTFCFKELA